MIVEPTEVEEISEEASEQLTDDVREALDRIAKDDQDGLIQPEAVVEAAKDPDSPLHKYFEWDVALAARAHWLARARHLIARYTVVRVDEGPKYVNVILRKGTSGARRGYVPTERAVADPDLYEQIVSDAETAVVSWRNRLSAFERAHGVVEALDTAVALMHADQPSEKRKPRKAAA